MAVRSSWAEGRCGPAISSPPDEDGVVVVPMERADAVADAAHALQEKEEKILHRILQDGVFDRPWLNAQLQALGCAPSKG